MLAEHLVQSQALRLVLKSANASALPSEETLAAALRCAEKLHLWGSYSGVLDLVESMGPVLDALPAGWILRIEFHRLRALSMLRRDIECLERARHLLVTHNDVRLSCTADYDRIRIIEGQALWHLNRTTEALSVVRQVRSELLGRAETALHAFCSSALASSLLMAGLWDEAREFAIETWILAKRVSAPLYEAMGLAQLCIAERGRCRWHSSADAAEESIQVYERIGARYQAALVRRSLAVTLWKRGDLRRASEVSSEVREVMLSAGLDTHAKYTQLLEALIQLHAGVVGSASGTLAQLNTVESLSESRPELLRLEYLGDVELEQGNAAEALRRYDEVLPHALALIPRGDVVAEQIGRAHV